ncbi:MAG: phosphoribosylglycinamide formyltransferase [Lachnospiraceae bacterium]
MLKIAVLASGGGTNLEAIFKAIDQGEITNAQVSVVISNNPKAYALKRAELHGVRHCCLSPSDFQERELFHEKLIEILEKEEVDLVVLAGYLVTISSSMVEKFHNRMINIHPSLIPSFCGKGYYGLKVHEAALKRGVKVTGATVHFVDSGTDTGPIILQKAVEVLPGDTPQILQKRVMEEAEWKILPKAIQMISSGELTVTEEK